MTRVQIQAEWDVLHSNLVSNVLEQNIIKDIKENFDGPKDIKLYIEE